MVCQSSASLKLNTKPLKPHAIHLVTCTASVPTDLLPYLPLSYFVGLFGAVETRHIVYVHTVTAPPPNGSSTHILSFLLFAHAHVDAALVFLPDSASPGLALSIPGIITCNKSLNLS